MCVVLTCALTVRWNILEVPDSLETKLLDQAGGRERGKEGGREGREEGARERGRELFRILNS